MRPFLYVRHEDDTEQSVSQYRTFQSTSSEIVEEMYVNVTRPSSTETTDTFGVSCVMHSGLGTDFAAALMRSGKAN